MTSPAPISPTPSKFKIGVLGSATGWYMRDLMRAALLHRDVEILPLAFNSLQVHSDCSLAVYAKPILPSDSKPSGMVSAASAVSLAELDCVIVRSMPLGSLEQIIFRMNALHVAEQIGVRVINSPRCLEVCIDKWLTLQKVRMAGILTPRTICCQDRDEALEAWHVLGEDCVVKPIFGGEGRGIVRVTDVDMAWRVFGTLSQLQSVMYVQEYVQNPGSDLRLLVMGDSIYSVRRSARGNWRTNASLGGAVEPYEPTFEQADIAFRASRAVGGWVVGVDLMESNDGQTLLLEANAVPGWRSTERALDVDLASCMLQQIMCETDSAPQLPGAP